MKIKGWLADIFSKPESTKTKLDWIEGGTTNVKGKKKVESGITGRAKNPGATKAGKNIRKRSVRVLRQAKEVQTRRTIR
jgi:hypothetical protein